MGINKIGGGVPDGAILPTAVKPVEKVEENPGIVKGPYNPEEHLGSGKGQGEGLAGELDAGQKSGGEQAGSQEWTAFPDEGSVIVDFTGEQRPKKNALVGKTGVAAYEAVQEIIQEPYDNTGSGLKPGLKPDSTIEEE